MNKIKAGEHPLISKSVQKVLSQNNVTTILEFLSEDAEKLSIITKLPLSQIVDIRSYYFATYSAKIESGTELFLQTATVKTHINSGISKLDKILSGGFQVGQISEVYGLAGCGKSQICMQVAVNCARLLEKTVLYIDTRGDFSAIHIQKMLHLYGLSYKAMAEVMLKIKIVYIWTMQDLIDFMRNLSTDSTVVDDLALIIVDSLPALMFQHFGDNNKFGLMFLNTFVTYCHSLGRKLQIAVICVNIETRWVELDTTDIDDDAAATDVKDKDNVYVERRTRCLGKYWQHIPSLLIHVERKRDAEQILLNVKVNKYNISPIVIGECTLSIDSTGVT